MSDVSTRQLHQGFWDSQPTNGAYFRTEFPLEVGLKTLENLCIQSIAQLGEKIIAGSALSAGWRIFQQRLRRPGFELDMIIHLGSMFRIVEVKTRRNPSSMPDSYLISQWMNQNKTSALRRGGVYLMHEVLRRKIPVTSISCDLVAVDLKSRERITAYRWPNVCELNS